MEILMKDPLIVFFVFVRFITHAKLLLQKMNKKTFYELF